MWNCRPNTENPKDKINLKASSNGCFFFPLLVINSSDETPSVKLKQFFFFLLGVWGLVVKLASNLKKRKSKESNSREQTKEIFDSFWYMDLWITSSLYGSVNKRWMSFVYWNNLTVTTDTTAIVNSFSNYDTTIKPPLPSRNKKVKK